MAFFTRSSSSFFFYNNTLDHASQVK
jgi:hypothetical protein